MPVIKTEFGIGARTGDRGVVLGRGGLEVAVGVIGDCEHVAAVRDGATTDSSTVLPPSENLECTWVSAFSQMPEVAQDFRSIRGRARAD